jgi:DNA-binding NtrC family response regulator
MTTLPETLQVWLCSLCPSDSLHLETVVSCLNQAQIATSEMRSYDIQGPGIVILSDITPEICEFVDSISRNGTERILVLVAEKAALARDDAWRILQAGASDILVWNDLPDPGSVIAGRLKRWREVDVLVESPLVRNQLVGQSRNWKSVLRDLVEVARFTPSPILLMGETGTGKELAARLIHALDQERNNHELVILDCTTIVPELSGSELFGHERGAFTGAIAARDGAFALANQGTLFLDEVGELPLGLQVQLLRVLEEKTYKRVGSNAWRQTDFRLICATNRDLQFEEAQGRFRRDLYYRIATWEIELPPLCERVEDIIPLVRHFIQQACPGQEPPELDESVQKYFLTREYPGNVRDLKNLVHRIIARYTGSGPITIGNIPSGDRLVTKFGPQSWCDSTTERTIRRAVTAGAGLKEIKRAIEEMAIQIAVEDKNGNLKHAAEKLGVTDRTLQKWRAEKGRRIHSMMNGNCVDLGKNDEGNAIGSPISNPGFSAGNHKMV